mmetsp:Transcript_82471/g.229903  ORF Transcript_82471/g.229903 Transcript_82471/m.229903 type:complete len:283 (+) Transcript_82471:620-1468(+)
MAPAPGRAPADPLPSAAAAPHRSNGTAVPCPLRGLRQLQAPCWPRPAPRRLAAPWEAMAVHPAPRRQYLRPHRAAALPSRQAATRIRRQLRSHRHSQWQWPRRRPRVFPQSLQHRAAPRPPERSGAQAQKAGSRVIFTQQEDFQTPVLAAWAARPRRHRARSRCAGTRRQVASASLRRATACRLALSRCPHRGRRFLRRRSHSRGKSRRGTGPLLQPGLPLPFLFLCQWRPWPSGRRRFLFRRYRSHRRSVLRPRPSRLPVVQPQVLALPPLPLPRRVEPPL